jgi:glutamine amidotransferase
MNTVISKKKPLFGICVGLQMFADVGYEEKETKGLGLDFRKSLKNRQSKWKV